MNRLFILGLWAVLLQPFAGASTLQTFTNDSFTTTLVNVPQSVVHIVNRGRIADQGVLETYDTLTFTNVAGLSGPQHSGVIQMTGGFWFNHNPSTGSFRRWADSFFNDNNALIQVVDGTRAAILPRAMVGPSFLRVWATNITVKGGSPGDISFPGSRASLITGANGEMHLWGGRVDLARSGLQVRPVWNQSLGSANLIDNGIFWPDIAVHDLAASTGFFGNPPNALPTGILWNGSQAQSYPAPPAGPATVGSFVLNQPVANFYVSADPSSRGIVIVTNFIPDFSANPPTVPPPATNTTVVTNVVIIPATFFSTNPIFQTNILSTNTFAWFDGTNGFTNVVFSENTFSFTNIFFPTNAFDTTNVVFTTNFLVSGTAFAFTEVRLPVTIFTNVVKGAFFGQAPPGFVINHGFIGGVGGRTIHATISTLVSNAVTGLSDVASVRVFDFLASANPDDVGFLLANALTATRPPQPPTGRPVSYVVDRGGTFSGIVVGTNVVSVLTNVVGSSISRLPDPNFFLNAGIADPANPLFFDPRHTTSFDSVSNSVVTDGVYSAYRGFFDNIVEREIASPHANFTNRSGRVRIDATTLNLDRTRIRGEGSITISTPHLISSTNAVIDCESLILDLASTNGTLRIQNLTKESVQRLRGPITVWSAMWSNSVTVVFSENFAITNGSLVVTNIVGGEEVVSTNFVVVRVPFTNTFAVTYHTMMLDGRQLTTTLPVTVYDLAARSPSVVIEDNMTVARSLRIDANRFTLNGVLSIPGTEFMNPLTGEVPTYINPLNGQITLLNPLRDWIGTNAPNLLFFTNNGLLYLGNRGWFGSDRTTPYLTFVNNGEIEAYNLRINSAYFENSGFIFSGSAVDMAGGTGVLSGGSGFSQGDTSFFSQNLTLTDYFWEAGGAINFFVTNRLSDGGQSSVLTAGNGFNLLIKPKSGDLLGTTLVSVAPDVPTPYPLHTWAAEDRGPTSAGFTDNAAIGVLMFDSIGEDPLYVFRGAGVRNGMYVDLLDFTGVDVANQIFIHPNLTIYYAAIAGVASPDPNLTPEQYIESISGGRLRWVPTFAGPNSSTTVNGAAVNTALVNSITLTGGNPATAIQTTTILVDVIGNGSVLPAVNGQPLIIGQTYTLVADPALGAEFVGWSGSIESASRQITFVMEPGLELAAHFSFAPPAATYNGLFYESSGVQMFQSGAITIRTTQNGRYTGHLLIGTDRYPFSGHMGESGGDIVFIPGANLELEFQVGTEQITGTITDGVWVADVLADRAPAGRQERSPFAGRYTIVFPGTDNPQNTMLPHGNGFGSVSVNSAGRLRLVGVLADGTRITQTSTVSRNGTWPLYVGLYGGEGQLLSWQTFAATPEPFLGGNFSWIKPEDFSTQYYPDGFNYEAASIGSAYSRTEDPVIGFANGVLMLTGGNLALDINEQITIDSRNRGSGANQLKVRINPATGLFQGRINDPVSGDLIKFGGAVLQSQGIGSGFFLGTDLSGRVLLSP